MKQGHTHTLAQTLNVAGGGATELEGPGGKACEEKAVLEEAVPMRRPMALEQDRTPPQREEPGPPPGARLAVHPREVGAPQCTGAAGSAQPLGRISGTPAPGVPPPQGWQQVAGRGPVVAGGPGGVWSLDTGKPGWGTPTR